ncbi:xanthine dehydrogenase family protein subunit M [Amycolatopsis sp. CA-128772]|uniref:FAD binding domain-containing protein n=1 Tax=Amycolatopsis sp. CA-128772 TaxID=2073159 RepID=UPI000CD17078|nr:xanthine dehydrogenase family protein subunit M [Amycolatopsis sp. CA-128772]
MKPFAYQRAGGIAEAVTAVTRNPDTAFLAGGTNLVDLMKLGVARPDTLVDISELPLGGIGRHPGGATVIGATVTNAALAGDPAVRREFPVLPEAVLAGASGQLRNAATVAGNLLQRTRCAYFQDVRKPCNKREPGSGCPARSGAHRDLGILGVSSACIATQPSDMAVGLAVLDATVTIHGPDGPRSVALRDFHTLPGDTPERETVLRHGDLITEIVLPPAPEGAVMHYRKVRDRWSYAFAVISVAALLTLRADGRIDQVRIAWGGVAPRPWRATVAEGLLPGQVPSVELFARAARAELRQATTLPQNAFKVDLTADVTAAVLTDLADRARNPEVTR